MKVSYIIRVFYRFLLSNLLSCNKFVYFFVLCIVKVKKLLKLKICSGKLCKFSLVFCYCYFVLDFKFFCNFFFVK